MPRPDLPAMLDASRVRLSLEAQDKEGVLRELAAIFASADPGLEAEEVFAQFKDREALGTTGLGSGVAIPHGRLHGLDGFRIAVARHLAGVDFEAVDGEDVHIFVAILAPAERNGQHVRLLAELSRVLRPAEARRRILEADSVEALLDVLR